MSSKSREIWRKIAHVAIGTGCLFGAYSILQTFGTTVLDLVAMLVLFLLVLCDILIADYGWKLPLYHQLQRKHETEGLHSATLAVMSSIIVYKLFSLPVAGAAIAMLIYGDAAAALVGLHTSKARQKQSLMRASAMAIVSAVIGWFFLGWVGVIMGIVATLAECFTTKIDDSITIPLFAGLAGHILLKFFL